MHAFDRMTPELRAYLEYKETGDPDADYLERKRLRGLIQPGLLQAYERVEIDATFVPENENPQCRREDTSPSGKYRLVVASYGTKPGCWSYTQGRVYRVGSDEPIAVINRNYSSFPYEFVEGHPNGHDYLVAGEDYQGQTVIELDTSRRRDHLPAEADDGIGFCWAGYKFDAASQILIVDGCYWACPYEFRFYDFSDPMAGWPELENKEGSYDDARWPTIEPGGIIRCYQTTDNDDSDEEIPVEKRDVASIQTFRREGLTLVFVEEWVSEKEKARRQKREENSRKWDEWVQTFKSSDPLYLAYRDLVKDPAFNPESYESHGVTYDGWCPDFKVQETRWCRRIHKSKGVTLDLEWGVKTGPIKLVVYRNGERAEDRFFEHSAAGMQAAFAYGKENLQ